MGVLTALQRHKYSPSFREAEPKTPAILGARPGSGRGMALLSARYGKRLTRGFGEMYIIDNNLYCMFKFKKEHMNSKTELYLS